jgi:prophage endopeptidase
VIDPRVYVAAAVVAVAAAGGWFANGWRLNAKIANLNAEHATLVASAHKATLRALEVEQERHATEERARDDIDAAKTAQLETAKHELQTLRDGVANGSIGLRVNASCPRSAGNVPARSSTPGMDDGAAPELTADARQNYYALREAIVTMTKQLEGLQELAARRSK